MSEAPDRADKIRHSLLTIRQCWDAMLPRSPRGTTAGTIGRTSHTPLPIPASILDVRAQTRSRLAGWCLVVIDDLDLHPSLDGQDAVGMARFLDVHAGYLAQHEAVEDVIEELADSERRCERIAEPPGALEFVGRCQVCDGDLRARQGGAALCRDCGQLVDAQTTREQLTREAEDRLMTASELVEIAHRLWDDPVTLVRINRWAKGGHLLAHGTKPMGERSLPLYRVGDVATALARMNTRRAS